METTPPGKNTGREAVERVAEAALGLVPAAGAALPVTFVITGCPGSSASSLSLSRASSSSPPARQPRAEAARRAS